MATWDSGEGDAFFILCQLGAHSLFPRFLVVW